LRTCQHLLESIQAARRLNLICIIFDQALSNIASIVASLASDRLSLLTGVVLHLTIDNATDCPLMVAKLRRSLRSQSPVNLTMLKVGTCTLEQPILLLEVTPSKVTVTGPTIINGCESPMRVDRCANITILVLLHLHCVYSLVAFELVHLHAMIRTN